MLLVGTTLKPDNKNIKESKEMKKKHVGYVLLLIPFSALICILSIKNGFILTLFTMSLIALFVYIIIKGISLISDDE